MNPLRWIIRKIDDGLEALGAMGDASVAVKPDNGVRVVVNVKCPSCSLTQLAPADGFGRQCAGCSAAITPLDLDNQAGFLRSTVVEGEDGKKRIETDWQPSGFEVIL